MRIRWQADGRGAAIADFSREARVAAIAREGRAELCREIANRGRKGLLGRFNRGAGGSQDPMAPADFGDGFLMKDGYTLVWVGWQFDVQPPFGSPSLPTARRQRSDSVADGSRPVLGYPDARAARPVAVQSPGFARTYRPRRRVRTRTPLRD